MEFKSICCSEQTHKIYWIYLRRKVGLELEQRKEEERKFIIQKRNLWDALKLSVQSKEENRNFSHAMFLLAWENTLYYSTCCEGNFSIQDIFLSSLFIILQKKTNTNTKLRYCVDFIHIKNYIVFMWIHTKAYFLS